MVAVGFRGVYGDDRIEYSQGDQPDIASYERDGSKVDLKMLAKKCAGHCDNFLTLSQGGGEDEETVFISVARLRVDTKDNELTIEGTKKSFMARFPNEPISMKFDKCEINAKLLEQIKASVP